MSVCFVCLPTNRCKRRTTTTFCRSRPIRTWRKATSCASVALILTAERVSWWCYLNRVLSELSCSETIPMTCCTFVFVTRTIITCNSPIDWPHLSHFIPNTLIQLNKLSSNPTIIHVICYTPSAYFPFLPSEPISFLQFRAAFQDDVAKFILSSSDKICDQFHHHSSHSPTMTDIVNLFPSSGTFPDQSLQYFAEEI